MKTLTKLSDPKPGGRGETGETSASPFLSEWDFFSQIPSEFYLISSLQPPHFYGCSAGPEDLI